MPESRATDRFLLKNMSVLKEIREIFYRTTGLVLSFHYPDKDDYDFYPTSEKNSFCRLIQSKEKGLKCCLNSDCAAMRKAYQSGEFCIYTCHAGLTNAVVPLVYKGQKIGAIFTGQIITEKQDEKSFETVYNKIAHLGFDKESVEKEFYRIKLFDKDNFLLGIRLLNFMANHIISVENEFHLLAELHQKENEKMRLKNNLQKLSILTLKDRVDFRTDYLDLKADSRQKEMTIQRAQEFIELNFSKTLALSDVAAAVYLSPNYFSSLFKEVTGYNFSSYLNRVRIEEAKKQLRENLLPIKQILEQVGFKDYNYFNRVFKKIVGVPPASYRDMFGTADK